MQNSVPRPSLLIVAGRVRSVSKARIESLPRYIDVPSSSLPLSVHPISSTLACLACLPPFPSPRLYRCSSSEKQAAKEKGGGGTKESGERRERGGRSLLFGPPSFLPPPFFFSQRGEFLHAWLQRREWSFPLFFWLASHRDLL